MAIAAHLKDETARTTVERRLKIALAMTLLLLGDAQLMVEAKRQGEEVAGDGAWALESLDVPTIYNIGAFLAVLAKAAPEEAEKLSNRALRFLAVALLRNIEMVDAFASVDEDLRDLHGLSELRTSAIVTLAKYPDLGTEPTLSEHVVNETLHRASARPQAE